MTSFRDVLERTRQEIREVNVADARALLENGAAALDVREGEEVAQGAIPNAVQIPRGYLELRVEDALPDKAQPVVVYCAGGTRSVFATKTLGELGYSDVVLVHGDGGLGGPAARAL